MPVRSYRARFAGVFVGCALVATCLTAASATATTLPTLSVAVSPSTATVTGALESGAVNIVTSDTGLKEANVILVALKPGVTVAEAETFIKEGKVKGDPNNAAKIGSSWPTSKPTPARKAKLRPNSSPATTSCWTATGEGEAALRTNFAITAAKAPVALPAPQRRSARSIGFRGPTTIHDGELVRFENEGFLVHMDIAVPVKNMKAARQLVKDMKTGNEKAAGKLSPGRRPGSPAPSPRGLPAGDDHREARHLRAGLLHANPGRA